MPLIHAIPGLWKTAAGGAVTYPLDLITPTARAAYSTRKLRTAYAGNCMKVRRSSDSTTLDIGFVAGTGLVDTAAILTFCGAGDGFIDTWYDQSTNASNATQATTTLQPKICASGAIITSINANPSIQFDGTDDLISTGLAASTLAPSGGYSTLSAVRPTAGGSNASGFQDMALYSGTSAHFGLTFQDTGTGSPKVWAYHNTTPAVASVASTAVPYTAVLGVRYNTTGTLLSVYYNGGTPGTVVAAPSGANTMSIGGGYSTYYYTGTVAELIFVDSLLSQADTNTIASAIATYAGTTWTSI